MDSGRKVIVQSNWKMHKTHAEAVAWIEALGRAAGAIPGERELIVCVPFVHLRAAALAAAPHPVLSIGAQNVHWAPAGAFTGEISAAMLADAGARYCVVGHSERREHFGETDERVNRKIRILLTHGIRPIVCIGESLAQREKGLTLQQVKRQVAVCFEGLMSAEMERTVVLYEPVWSIGTGISATAPQAQEAHRFAREAIAATYSADAARAVRIIYGGSVKARNVSAIMAGEDIDGVGVGSGSLDVGEFVEIVKRSCPNR